MTLKKLLSTVFTIAISVGSIVESHGAVSVLAEAGGTSIRAFSRYAVHGMRVAGTQVRHYSQRHSTILTPAHGKRAIHTWLTDIPTEKIKECSSLSEIEKFLAPVLHSRRESTRYAESDLAVIPPSISFFVRGQSTGHEPIPGIMRPKGKLLDLNGAMGYIELENPISFKGKSVFEKYSLAQHHGMPTGLLDFTGQSNIAAYFAVSGFNEHGPQEEQPYLIVIDAAAINEQYRISPNKGIAKPDNFDVILRLQAAEHISLAELLNDPIVVEAANKENISLTQENILQIKDKMQYPVAVYPHMTHPRIKNQYGRFLVFLSRGKQISKDIPEPKKMDPRFYTMIVKIKRDKIKGIMQELSDIGVNRKVIYPGLDSEIMEAVAIFSN